MFRNFFDTSAVKIIAEKVSVELRKSFPPSVFHDESKFEVKRQQIAEHLRRHAQKAAAGTKLNIYQKAKLGIQLQEAFERAGYASVISKSIAHDVVSLIAWSA